VKINFEVNERMGTSMIRKSRGKAEVSLPPQEAGPSWLNEYLADFF
jgi:hypothetical protein